MKNHLENFLIHILKIYTKIPGITLTDKLAKNCSKTKIDSLQEYINIRIVSSFYKNFYFAIHLELKNKTDYAKTIMEVVDEVITLAQKLPIAKDGITYDWLQDGLNLAEEIKIDLEKFLLHSENITFYKNSIEKMKNFCMQYESNYEEWQTELKKYEEGNKKASLIITTFGLTILLIALNLFETYNHYATFQEFDYREEIELESTMSEEQILYRKR